MSDNVQPLNMTFPGANQPWVYVKLPNKTIVHLWNIIENVDNNIMNSELAGNISKSIEVKDTDNYLFENNLNYYCEYMFYSIWDNYYNVHIHKTIPPPKFKLGKMWVNYQKQHEFNPIHKHSGMFSFVIMMKIPTDSKEQHDLPISKNSIFPCASNFQFLIGKENGHADTVNVELSPEDEGKMFFFPSWLCHQVYPFYGTEEDRITIAGNIIPDMEFLP